MFARSASAAFALTTATLAGGAEAQPVSVEVQGECQVVRIRADGARTVTPPRRSSTTGEVVVTVRKGGSVGTARMAGSGRSRSTTNINGVSITLTRDDRGCLAVIDERAQQGGST